MTRTFQSPSAYDFSYSLLGRAFRAWTGDRLRGEALFLVSLTGLGLLLLMSQYLTWAFLKPVLEDHLFWQMLFWTGQALSILVLAGFGLVGVRPGVTVTCTPTTLEVEQGDRGRTVFYEDIEDVDRVSATRYHRHYRLYAATQAFLARRTGEMLLLHVGQTPVVIALADVEQQAALCAYLKTAAEVPESVPELHP